jgi:hypothetical protein
MPNGVQDHWAREFPVATTLISLRLDEGIVVDGLSHGWPGEHRMTCVSQGKSASSRLFGLVCIGLICSLVGCSSDDQNDSSTEADAQQMSSDTSESVDDTGGSSLDNETCNTCCEELGYQAGGNSRPANGCKCFGVSGGRPIQETISAEDCRSALPEKGDVGTEDAGAQMDAGDSG